MSDSGGKGRYVPASDIVEARERLARRQAEAEELTPEQQAAAAEDARKHLRESGLGEFTRTGRVKEGISPKHVRRSLTPNDYRRMNLPREHWNAHSREIQDAEIRKVIQNYGKNIIEMIRSSTGLIIPGDPGTGKSSVAAILAKEAVRWGFSAYFVTQEELADLRYEDQPFAEGLSVMGRIRSADFLVLDNFDDRFLADKRFGPIELEKLVRRRNANLKTTAITIRHTTIKQLGSKDDEDRARFPGVMSTLNARTATVPLYGKDMRVLSKQKAHEKVFGTGAE